MISIIVPVYNVEKYIERCIKSLLQQSYKDLEIILVNDGSKDKSGEICEFWKKKDSRIKVIHKENGGLPSARNEGLKNANGENILFVDSDDFLIKNACQTLSLYLNYDMVLFKYYRLKKKGEIIKFNSPETEGVYFGEQIINLLINSLGYSYLNKRQSIKVTHSAWRSMYKKDIIDSWNLCFKNIKYIEDFFFHLDYIEKCKKILILNKYIYVYRENPDSIINSYKKNQSEVTKMYLNKILSYKNKYNTFYDKQILDRYKYEKAYCYANLILNELRSFKNNIDKKSFTKINKIAQDKDFKSLLSLRFIFQQEIRFIIFFLLIRLNLLHLIKIFFIKKKENNNL